MLVRHWLVRVLACLAAVLLALPGGALHAAPAVDGPYCFRETGLCVSIRFYTYWRDVHGGLAQQGLPVTHEFSETNPVDGQTYRVQYFERARFESHVTPSGPVILLGLLGREQYLARYPEGRPAGGGGDTCFDVTGRCVRGIFYQYWLAHGGLAQQGYPLSDEFDEVNPQDGRTYRVQYFERARFEYHPENADLQYQVLLGLAGGEQVAARYPQGIPAPAPSRGPAPQAFYTAFLATNQNLLVRQVTADVTGDGQQETLLLAVGKGCGSCRLFRLLVFSGEQLLFDTLYDLVEIDSIAPAADHGGFAITQGFPRGNEPLCCVTGRRTFTHRWDGWAFIVVSIDER